MQTVFARSVRLAALLSLLVLGCDRVPTHPEGEALHLTLSISSTSGDPQHPVRMRAQIRNDGRHKVLYTKRGPSLTFGLIIRDPERRALAGICWECPNRGCPDFPGVIVSLAPGESAVVEWAFSGTLHDCDGPFQGSSGTYAVEAVFVAWSEAEQQRRISLSKTGSFVWSAQGPD